MRNRFVILIVLFSHVSFGQGPKLRGPELIWAIFHPLAAIQVKKITKYNTKTIDQKKVHLTLDSFSNGGKADAFRHTYNMASYAQKIRTKKLRKLGEAHERSNYKQFKKSNLEYGEIPDSLSSVMDLKNNELGFTLGCSNKNATADELFLKVIAEINSGKAIIMKRNREGKFIDCKCIPLDFKTLGKKWNIPKCLVASDYRYQD